MCTIIRKAGCWNAVILERVKLLGSSWSSNLWRLVSSRRRGNGWRGHWTGVGQRVQQTVDSVPQRSELAPDVLDALGAGHSAALARNQQAQFQAAAHLDGECQIRAVKYRDQVTI